MTEFFFTNQDRNKQGFVSKFMNLFELDPNGTEWVSLGEVLSMVQYRPAFHYDFSYMVLWLRELCVEAGLTREDRVSGPGHVDMAEGYFGILRKAE